MIKHGDTDIIGCNGSMRTVKQGRKGPNRVKAKVKRPINVPGQVDKLHNNKKKKSFRISSTDFIYPRGKCSTAIFYSRCPSNHSTKETDTRRRYYNSQR